MACGHRQQTRGRLCHCARPPFFIGFCAQSLSRLTAGGTGSPAYSGQASKGHANEARRLRGLNMCDACARA